MDKIHDIVYSKQVLEFVTVANEYCAFLERTDEFKREEFVNTVHKVLPLLYLKAILLPKIDSQLEDVNEKFLTEADYYLVHDKIKAKLGQFDNYEEVFDPLRQESEEPVSASLAEDLSDIYQDIKDFLMLYRLSTNEIMNDAIWECQQNFEQYWGQKLVNALRALHNLLYSGVDLEEDTDKDNFIPSDDNDSEIDTSSWFITRRQEETRDDE